MSFRRFSSSSSSLSESSSGERADFCLGSDGSEEEDEEEETDADTEEEDVLLVFVVVSEVEDCCVADVESYPPLTAFLTASHSTLTTLLLVFLNVEVGDMMSLVLESVTAGNWTRGLGSSFRGDGWSVLFAGCGTEEEVIAAAGAAASFGGSVSSGSGSSP